MKRKKIILGFTLIEMIIAIGIMGMLSGLAASALVNIMKGQKIINITHSALEDAEIVIGLLSAEIQNNAVDYEEYYNWNIFGYHFGANYGEYAKTMKNGAVKGKNAIECYYEACYRTYLALISPDGKTKKIFAPEYNKSLDERVLSVLELKGCDGDNDGVAEKFVRMEESCETAEGGNITDAELTTVNTNGPYGGDFNPMSTMKTNIVDLKFFVTPVNDPHKAYAMPEYVYQPKVTIVLKIKPSKSYFGNAAEKAAPITVYKTVSPRFTDEVKS